MSKIKTEYDFSNAGLKWRTSDDGLWVEDFIRLASGLNWLDKCTFAAAIQFRDVDRKYKIPYEDLAKYLHISKVRAKNIMIKLNDIGWLFGFNERSNACSFEMIALDDNPGYGGLWIPSVVRESPALTWHERCIWSYCRYRFPKANVMMRSSLVVNIHRAMDCSQDVVRKAFKKFQDNRFMYIATMLGHPTCIFTTPDDAVFRLEADDIDLQEAIELVLRSGHEDLSTLQQN